MRNSVILIDTNILLNYITNREDPYLEQSIEIVSEYYGPFCSSKPELEQHHSG